VTCCAGCIFGGSLPGQHGMPCRTLTILTQWFCQPYAYLLGLSGRQLTCRDGEGRNKGTHVGRRREKEEGGWSVPNYWHISRHSCQCNNLKMAIGAHYLLPSLDEMAPSPPSMASLGGSGGTKKALVQIWQQWHALYVISSIHHRCISFPCP
jgi:hypothetical protein